MGAAPAADPPPAGDEPPAAGAPTFVPSGFAGPAGGPSVAIATYDPKTGQFATPDGGVYRQTDLAAPDGQRSWQDLMPMG